ncbi:MAG: hypothetical protein ACHQ7N_16415 [Candidatus Methylomirabilales bacterium]
MACLGSDCQAPTATLPAMRLITNPTSASARRIWTADEVEGKLSAKTASSAPPLRPTKAGTPMRPTLRPVMNIGTARMATPSTQPNTPPYRLMT